MSTDTNVGPHWVPSLLREQDLSNEYCHRGGPLVSSTNDNSVGVVLHPEHADPYRASHCVHSTLLPYARRLLKRG